MRNFKYILFVVFFLFYFQANAQIVYPIQTMSKLDCRFQDFSTLWDDCKMQLPILNTKDYSKYKNDYSLYRRVYTILWWSSYNYWWDVWNWGHQWVDIASAKWTPVYSITDGKVINATNMTWRWNTVKIEHIINWKKVYSNYAHLSKILVSVWDSVQANSKIWEIWNTWNSYWNHLHFQIDVSVSWKWPRYRSNCKEKNYNNIVNSSVCFEQLSTNTIDPLLFLETSWAVIKANEIEKPKQQIISKEGMISRAEILKREIDEFLKSYDVKVNIIWLWWSIDLWKTWNFRIIVTDKRTKRPFTWSFPWDMNFKFDWKRFDIFPTGILQIDNWVRDFKVTPKISWKMDLDVYIWETFYKKVTFWVIDTKKPIIPSSWVILIQNQNVIWSNSKSILYFKDNYWLNILWHKFNWNFKIYSKDKTIKFCLKKWNSLSEISYLYNSNCEEKSFKDIINFSYINSISWIYVLEYKTLNLWLNNINIDYEWKEFLSRKVSWIFPYWLDISYPYYSSIINLLKNWISSWISKWYFMQDRELSTYDWVNMLNQILEYKLSNCLDDICKKNYLEKINNLLKIQTDKYIFFTRGDYLKLIWESVMLKEYDWSEFIFRDLSDDLKKYSKNILKGQTWIDYFWQTRYFQPDKKITRWEWAYLIDSIFKE